jgi:hypothetical protein
LPHPVQEVEPWGAERSDAGDGGASKDPVGQRRGAGQGMGTTTRPAGRVEPPRPEPLDDRQRVSCAVGGNAFAILGRTAAALRGAGVSPEEIDAYFTQAISGDYHLLATTMTWVDWQ